MKVLTVDEVRDDDDDCAWCEADHVMCEIMALQDRLRPIRHVFSEFNKLRRARDTIAAMGLPVSPHVTSRLQSMMREINRALIVKK